VCVMSRGEGMGLSACFYHRVCSTAGYLEVAPTASMVLHNGAKASNIFWALGAYAELGASSTTVGTIVAMSYVWMGTSADLQGAALSLNAAVTLDTVSVTLQRVGIANTFTFSHTGTQSQTVTQTLSTGATPSATPTQTRTPVRRGCCMLYFDTHARKHAHRHLRYYVWRTL
jgi:hypothetical protein